MLKILPFLCSYSFAQYVTVENENDKLLFDAQIEVSVFDPGQDSFVSVPGGTIISDIVKYSYAHHIQRLMFLGNWFLINQVSPKFLLYKLDNILFQ